VATAFIELRCGFVDRRSFSTHPQKPFINQETCDE